MVYPLNMALSLATLALDATTRNADGVTSVSPILKFTSSLNFSVAVSGFATQSGNGSRRAVASQCPAGSEWRYAKLGTTGSAICGCAANAACTGPTSCSVTPASGDQWRVVSVATTVCNPGAWERAPVGPGAGRRGARARGAVGLGVRNAPTPWL